jgi:hypothetical protein
MISKPVASDYAKPTSDYEQDTSPQVGSIVLTVTRKEYVPIKSSSSGKLTYGQVLDDALIAFYDNEHDPNSLISNLGIELSEDAAFNLRDNIRLRKGEYRKKV